MIRKIHWGDLAIPLFLFFIVNAGNFGGFWFYLATGIVAVSYLFAFLMPFDTFYFPTWFLHFFISYSLTGLFYLISKNILISITLVVFIIFLWEIYQKIQIYKKVSFLKKTWSFEDFKLDLDTILDIIFGFLGMIFFIILKFS